MALPTPDELLNVLEGRRKVVYDSILKQIENKLKSEYFGAEVIVNVDFHSNEIQPVLPKLKETLKASRWNIVVGRTDSHRNETSTEIRISPIMGLTGSALAEAYYNK